MTQPPAITRMRVIESAMQSMVLIHNLLRKKPTKTRLAIELMCRTEISRATAFRHAAAALRVQERMRK